ncbi:MAG: response regulator [Hyphomicrobiales bacterium]
MAKILIAEDDEAVRTFVSRALMIDGHEITTAEDGTDALSVLSHDDKFDLLLSDIKMPIMDGIALALNVARDHPHITILLMTGYADQRERADGLDKIVDDVVLKPFSLAQIRKAVSDTLEKITHAA